jgi:carbonic anhydrase
MNNLPNSPKAALSRRKFLGTALAGTAATLAGAASMSFFSTKPALAQSNLTPDEALNALLTGNERSVSGRLTSFDQDLKILRDHTVDKQEPFAAVLSCADSRVPVEIIFDQTIGHIFVSRVAGNVVTPEIIGPASNTAPPSSGRRSSSFSAIPDAAQSRRPSRARRFRDR